MSRWTIVPIRGLAAGKSRLAGVLNHQHRQVLVMGRLDDDHFLRRRRRPRRLFNQLRHFRC